MRKAFKYLIVTTTLLLMGGCFLYFTFKRKDTERKQKAAYNARNYYFNIPNLDAFIGIQGPPLSGKFNDVRTVKVVYDMSTRKLYFLNSERYHFHYDFCNDVLGCKYSLTIFNTINYSSTEKRDYLLANLNRYGQSGIYTMEFSSEDRILPVQLNAFYKLVTENTYLKDSLKIFLSSDYLSAMNDSGLIKAPVISPTEVYKGQKYQMLHKGVTYGYLKIVNDLQKEYEQVKPENVIIIKGTPVSIPICSGIITNALQTPLSHINVLCNNRDLASAADVNIFDKRWVRELANKPVMVIINEDSVSISASTAEEVEKFLKKNKTTKITKLRANTKDKDLIPAADIDKSDKNTIGNKAVGVGILYKIAAKKRSNFSVPEGAFAIPFYYYSKHVGNVAVQTEINKLLADSSANAATIKKQLKQIRQAIKDAAMDKELLTLVTKQIVANKVGKSYRFRSSSNAEDMEGFSGAGLYDSKTGILNDTAKSIEEAIKDVWASTWNEQAYMERNWAHIDQHTIMMGIIAHRNFPDEAANGVAITKNIYRRNFPGFTINVQQGEVSVVSPPEKVTCEQFICMRADEINPMNSDVTAEYLTHSSLTGGRPVLTMQQVTLLYEQLEFIKQYFYYNEREGDDTLYENYALDMEFKFEKNGKLYVKQVRPYE